MSYQLWKKQQTIGHLSFLHSSRIQSEFVHIRTDELDLDKEISYDMHIAPDGFSIPIGNLDRIYIDSLIKTNEDGSALVILPNGEYGIKTDGQINRVNINIAMLP